MWKDFILSLLTRRLETGMKADEKRMVGGLLKYVLLGLHPVNIL